VESLLLVTDRVIPTTSDFPLVMDLDSRERASERRATTEPVEEQAVAAELGFGVIEGICHHQP
jgi:hypothetical protein